MLDMETETLVSTKPERKAAAAALGSAKSERKAAAVRENGKLGGRAPKHCQLSPEELREYRQLQGSAAFLNREGQSRLRELASRYGK
jgi:hypothetical protein